MCIVAPLTITVIFREAIIADGRADGFNVTSFVASVIAVTIVTVSIIAMFVTVVTNSTEVFYVHGIFYRTKVSAILAKEVVFRIIRTFGTNKTP
jgi:hypothetical protein